MVAALLVCSVVGMLRYDVSPFHLAPWHGTRAPLPDTQQEPAQEDLPASTPPVLWQHHGARMLLQPIATYRIAGRVVAQDTFYLDPYAVAVPHDLTIAWGPLLDPQVLDAISFRHYLRRGSYQYKLPPPVSLEVLQSHVSNNHVIGATPRVSQALSSIDVGDIVELQGFLGDLIIQRNGEHTVEMQTSRTRTDTGDGACEVVYVQRVQINRHIYE